MLMGYLSFCIIQVFGRIASFFCGGVAGEVFGGLLWAGFHIRFWEYGTFFGGLGGEGFCGGLELVGCGEFEVAACFGVG